MQVSWLRKYRTHNFFISSIHHGQNQNSVYKPHGFLCGVRAFNSSTVGINLVDSALLSPLDKKIKVK